MSIRNDLYKTAIYMRISKDDNSPGESGSIESQRKILKKFCCDNGFYITGEYVDNGFSGTNFENRPGFSKLTADIEMDKINLVITKDLSRLGRNSAETGFLLDTFFPKKRVRYISVTENLDTDRRDSSYNIITPVYNFTNELYSADISNKIRSSLETKMKNGEFIGSFAPFGYKKDKSNKNLLVPDKTASEIVKEIFTLAENGHSSYEISVFLNNKSSPTPSAYRNNGNRISSKWTPSTVIKILNNRVYLGHTVQGKTKKPSFKSKCSYPVPKSEWIICKNTHMPLISQDAWDRAHASLKSRTKRHNYKFENIFSGIVKCFDCDRNMSSAVSGNNKYLVCGGYKHGGKNMCNNHRISYDFLCSAVTRVLKEFTYFSDKEKTAFLNEIITEKNKFLLKEISDCEQRIEVLNQKILKLFDDKYSDFIESSSFSALLNKYKTEKEQAETNLALLKKAKIEFEQTCLLDISSVYDRIMNFEQLTTEILNCFIEKIYIHQPDNCKVAIDIYFKSKSDKQYTKLKIIV